MKLLELFEAKKFGFDTFNKDIQFDSDTDPEYINWLNQKRKDNPEERKRGPHEGKYLTLMLQGLKPAALVPEERMEKFKPHIKSGKIINMGKLPAGDFVLVLPGEEWRGRTIIKNWDNEINTELNHKDLELGEIRIGKLLGYSNSEIRHFLNNIPT